MDGSAKIAGQLACAIWFTGLSGAGKSSAATALKHKLQAEGYKSCLLDGDDVRRGLCSDLGFSEEDRVENLRRVAEVTRLMVEAGLIVIVATISPYRRERTMARDLLAPNRFVEVFVDTPLDICEMRDPKGLYAKARAGELDDFTGVDAPYERPETPEIRLKPSNGTPGACGELIFDHLISNGLI